MFTQTHTPGNVNKEITDHSLGPLTQDKRITDRMDHRTKIHLNIRDVRHLQAQFAKDATEKSDLYLPTTDNSDPLKHRVADLVNDFIYEIFERARDSMEIDGADTTASLRSLIENPTNEVEPFDFSLQEQVRKLYQEVEDETIRLTNLRRETPQSLKATYQQSFAKSFGILESFQKEIDNLVNANEDPASSQKEATFVTEVQPKLDRLTKEYEASLETLKQIKDNIPQERGELEKLEHITRFLKDCQ